MRVALDAMGGRFCPRNIVEGGRTGPGGLSAPDQTVYLVGDRTAVQSELQRLGFVDPRVEIFHASQVVDMADEAVASVRKKKDSSISRAVDLVKKGQADAVVSAGHTGAAVAASSIKLRTLPGIERAGHCHDDPDGEQSLRPHRRRGEPGRQGHSPAPVRDHGIGVLAPCAQI